MLGSVRGAAREAVPTAIVYIATVLRSLRWMTNGTPKWMTRCKGSGSRASMVTTRSRRFLEHIDGGAGLPARDDAYSVIT